MGENQVIFWYRRIYFNFSIARYIADLPESTGLIHQEEAISYYNSFTREKSESTTTTKS